MAFADIFLAFGILISIGINVWFSARTDDIKSIKYLLMAILQAIVLLPVIGEIL